MKHKIMTLGLVLFSLTSFAAELDTKELLEGYSRTSTALAYDHFAQTQDHAKQLARLGEDWLKAAKESDVNVPHVKKLVEGALAMSQTKEEAVLRAKYAILAEGACRLLKNEAETQKQWQLYRCPMVKTFPFWAQPKNLPMANPYMGLSMLQCGTKKAWTALE